MTVAADVAKLIQHSVAPVLRAWIDAFGAGVPFFGSAGVDAESGAVRMRIGLLDTQILAKSERDAAVSHCTDAVLESVLRSRTWQFISALVDGIACSYFALTRVFRAACRGVRNHADCTGTKWRWCT